MQQDAISLISFLIGKLTFQLPHRTVGEIVHFYYIWKKTERHDMFQERARGTKNQEHPNCTYVYFYSMCICQSVAVFSRHRSYCLLPFFLEIEVLNFLTNILNDYK